MSESSASRVLYLIDDTAASFVEQWLTIAVNPQDSRLEGSKRNAEGMRELLGRVATLQQAGFRCEVGRMADDAVNRVVDAPPNLIILDVAGYTKATRQLQRDLKQHPTARAVPLIILTNDRRTRLRFRARVIGCEGYLVRPALSTLYSEIQRICAAGLRLPQAAAW